jgi:4-hydroxy-3-methylbut-2-enyl diphosphate reductase
MAKTKQSGAAEKSSVQRRSFGLRDEVKPRLHDEYHSELVERIREGGHEIVFGDTRILLAREFGFCYGVDRSVELAYETVERFPDRRIYITAEIIHNPRVNSRLRGMGVRFLSSHLNEGESYDDLRPDDVIILPAFGVGSDVQKMLEAKGCQMVDTTCGSVVLVWKRVERYARDGFTSIIHGTFTHEETMATSSRALAEGGKYLVVRNKEEAEFVSDALENGCEADEFEKRFAKAASPDFDPAKDLEKIGLANQTTMLSGESMAISQMLRAAMERRYGPGHVAQNFRSFDTICSATQDRQDAIHDLRERKPDLVLIVGGFNSSNTGHLREIASTFAPSYHVDGAECLLSAETIRHKPAGSGELAFEENWLPGGNLTVGLTAGASTPNRVTAEVIERLLELRGAGMSQIKNALSDDETAS